MDRNLDLHVQCVPPYLPNIAKPDSGFVNLTKAQQ
jgi:hypothetical protein